MLFEVAITPQAFDAEVHRGSDDGYFLASLLEAAVRHGAIADIECGEWSRAVTRALQSGTDKWPAQCRKDVIDLLSHLKSRNRLLPRRASLGFNPASLDDWVDAIKRENTRYPFDRVVADHSATQLFEDSELIWCEMGDRSALRSLTESQGQVTVRLCQVSYQPILKSLLRNSRIVKVVDPYLKPGNSKFVELCAKEIASEYSDERVPKVEIHSSIEKQRDDYAHEWATRKSQIINRVGRLLDVSIYIWGARKDDPYTFIHDRALFSDQCAIKSGHSFVCKGNDTKQNTDWSIMADKIAIQRRDEIVAETSPYDLVAKM